MSRTEIRAFDDEHVSGAGLALAARHRQHRVARPMLSPAFEATGVAEKEVAAAWTSPGASGAVALRNGRVVGFLLGAPKQSSTWGPNMWVESAGQALLDEEPAETMRDLYAVAAQRWVDEGRTAHYVIVPATDGALVDAWFRLGFGQQHVHGVRPPLADPPGAPDGLVIRRAQRGDIPVLARLDVSLPHHQGLSPTFSAGDMSTVEAAISEWEEDFDDPDFATFVAVIDNAVVGSAVGCDLTKSSSNSGLMRPEHAGFLGFAAVLPDARGRGAGRALGETVLHWAAETGYPIVQTDWRATNLLSSRAWTALGFVPTFLRLHRTIGY